MLHRIMAAVIGLLITLAPALAEPLDVSGVKFEQALQLRGTPLVLNGAGVRYKAIFKVYAAALYLPERASSAEAVLAAPGPRRLNIVMLRAIDANELGRLFTRGMEQNAAREEFAKSIPGTIKMGEIFAAQKRLSAGESFQIDWIPGEGTVISVNDKPAAGAIREPEFYSAMLKLWLGPQPADPALKDALLGKAPATPRGRHNAD
ncbi:chalcone isomerase family protein [Aquabacterium sp. A7-Y]|uniref:chalcone isomerase family protein n=1 Tax=Aquabacterium sp. A7-Y TaxID=1349605 RepID=UPI00223CDBAC|nr:chalcone isomerase family protein [Aquabacterium sp. A7-Y]MCW7539506.1 chalcone isomerase family protein [Aquabacterium sp. A7-Y]